MTSKISVKFIQLLKQEQSVNRVELLPKGGDTLILMKEF